MKKSRKILSLVLALVMLFSAVPATVFAAEPGTYAFTDSMTASLELESEVIMVVSPEMTVDGKALTAAEAEAVEGNVGILLWDAATAPAEAEATADTCENVVMGAEYNAVTGRFDVRTEGIAAKNLGDSLAVRSFYVDGEGNYTYGKYVASYSPKKYCYNQISGSDANLSAVCVALLNYGAAAQTYFRYNTENMMNAELTPAQQQVPWSSSLVRSVWGVAPAKEGALRRQNPPINSRGGSLELEGALNVVFTGGVDASIEVAKAQMLLWDEAAFNGMDVLTAESATEVVEMTLREDGKYEYVREDIPAKAMFDTIYACQMYTDVDGNVYYGGVLPFCAERYGFMKQFSEHDNLSAVTKAMIVYGDAARTYFSNQPGDDNQSGSENLTAGVELNADGTVKEAVSMDNGEIGATVPAGVAADKTTLTLQVSEKASSDADVETDENETTLSLDVHVDGVAAGNTKAIIVKLGDILPKALNIGNVALYHVEGGVTKEMTRVMTMEELDEHNEYYYDPVTGEVYVAMASFSEITMVAGEAVWEGSIADGFASGSGTEEDPYIIANADQLAAFGAMVGGMTDKFAERNSFEGKYIKLIADINLGDAEENNVADKIFYPIGYYNSDDTYEKTGTTITSNVSSFEGIFDGNGHTVSNFYQNTWEMKGDHDWYDANLQYYRDAMGLFGYVYNGTVKNLSVDNFSCDGEIAPSGVIATYAAGECLFENISVTNCNPRIYNIGNGGIVGIAGDSEASENTITLRNITVDQTNKISALWETPGGVCGGLIGMFRGYSPIVIENCHVAAIMDVYNDVCANYQYYWYRYCGMIIGSNRVHVKDDDGYTVADTSMITIKDTTYTMGAWNEYWYCELVKNTIASYTHDHQFSRLTTIAALSEIQDENGNWNKEGNYVIPAADKSSAECFHIFKDSEGNLYQHFHDVADDTNPNIYETFDLNGDGELNDLKEDRQCYYIPFGQLMNGWDHGIKPTYEMEGVTLVEDGTVRSEAKFEALVDSSYTCEPDVAVKIGDLFRAIVDSSKLSNPTVQVFVSPVGEESTVSAKYSASVPDWDKGTLTFSGEGAATVTITDYIYCTPTVIRINVAAPKPAPKFEAKTVDAQSAYTQITLDQLFGLLDSVELGNVTATVTDPNGAVTEISAAADTWAAQTITVVKDGDWTVSIKDDDDLCEPTEMTFSVAKADKFTKKFASTKFTYRVGNSGTVALKYLFGEINADIAPVNLQVAVTNVKGTASGVYTSNATWNNGYIQFSGTGIVTVTISADGANAVSLTLEVVDAVNATGAANATANDVVLLQNAGFSSLTVSGGHTLYGNGFTLTCSSDLATLDLGSGFVTLDSGTLDNVQIVTPNLDHAILYKGNMADGNNRTEVEGTKTRYYNTRSGVMVSGKSQILNSRVAGGRAAVNVSGGNVLIENSQIELGAVASLLVGTANELILRDVTLVQEPAESNYKASGATAGTTLMGFSVLIMCDADGNSTPIKLEGDLIQYAWIDEGDSQYVPSAGQAVISAVMKKTDYLHDLNADGTNESLNLGFAYMPAEANGKVNEGTIEDNRTNRTAAPYDYAEVSSMFLSTQVYSYKNTNGTDAAFMTKPVFEPNAYADMQPVLAYSDANADRTLTRRYDIEEGWVYDLTVDLDQGEYTLDYSTLTMSRSGVTLAYQVDGAAPAATAVTEGTNDHTLTATDEGKTYTVRLNLIGTATSKDAPQWSSDSNGTALATSMNASWEAGVCVASSRGGTWSGAAPALQNVYVRYYSTEAKAYKIIHLADYTPATTGKLNGTNTTYTIEGPDFTLTLTGGQVHSSNKVNAMPVVVDWEGTNKLFFVAASSNGLVNTGNGARSIPVTYSFTDDFGNTLSGSHSWSVSENQDAEYKYSDFCNGTKTLLEASSGGCITPDTLITLADGTQVRVDSLTGSEELLVWNMETGMLDTAPIMFVDRDPAAECEVVYLHFSDGTEVKVIYEHGFWNYDLNRYVYLDENAAAYIGHTFAKQNGDSLEKVQLTDVTIVTEFTDVWSPVTVGHLCYFVNGMLSMPGGVGGLFNIFDVDPETMTYDYEAMERDVETYGLFTYEELNAIEPLSKDMFDAAGGAYLKISIGKGNLTMDELCTMIRRYSNFFA